MMKGKTVLVTGATNGIGKETARGLARLGARVIIVGRDAEKSARVVREIQTDTGNSNVEALLADLTLQADVRQLAEQVNAKLSRLDVLVNNAGTIYMKREVTSEGIEKTWALNHLAYFLLTDLLLPLLKDSAPARIVNVSSSGHRGGKIDFDDIMMEKNYRGFARYNATKLANVLFTRELAKRLRGTGVTVNAVHPGFVPAAFTRGTDFGSQMFLLFTRPFAKTLTEGAATSLYVATSHEIEGVTGRYFADSRETVPAAAAQDDATAQRLWALSEAQVGIGADVSAV